MNKKEIKVSTEPYIRFIQRCHENYATITWFVELNDHNKECLRKLLHLVQKNQLHGSFYTKDGTAPEYVVDVLFQEIREESLQYRKLLGNLDMDKIKSLENADKDTLFYDLDYEAGGLEDFLMEKTEG